MRCVAAPRPAETPLARLGVLIAGTAFAAGALAGGAHVSSSQHAAERFATAWARGDFAAMYSELSPQEQNRIRRGAFTRAYQRALDTATAQRIVTGAPARDGDAYRIPVRVDTRLWGSIDG